MSSREVSALEIPFAPAAPPPPPGPRLHPLLRAALYLVSFVAIQVLVSTLVFALAVLLPDRVTKSGFAQSDLIFLALFVVLFPPVVGLTYLFVRYLDRKTLAGIGARWPRGGRRAALRQLGTVSLGTLAVVAVWLALILALPDGLVALHLED